jgi:DNA-binding NarL/FixJ family response regulator
MLFSAIIAEDHDVTRRGVRSLLETEMEARVSATTRDGLEVPALLDEHNPDLLILDIGLPGLNGLDILHEIKTERQDLEILVLSIKDEDAYVQEAFSNGASGYVLKGAPAEELMDGIRAVMNGETYLGDGLPDSLLETDPSVDEDVRDRHEVLTEREREVLQLTGEGLTSKEIGRALHISHRTVDKHRQNIREKLGLRNSMEMVRYALEQNPTPDGNGDVSV